MKRMASLIKMLQRILFSVLIFSTGILVWNLVHLTVSRKNQKYRKDLPLKLTNENHGITDFQKFEMDKGNNVTEHRRLESFNHLAKPVKIKPSINTNDSWSEFSYPLDVDMVELVRKLKSNIPVKYKPLFVYQYIFKHYRIDKCVDGSPFFIFLIKSAVNNIEKRAAIRVTWSQLSLMEKYNGVRLFLLGTPDKQMELSALEEEINLHKDMIIMTFYDNYLNNTLKTMGAIHWTVNHCNRSKFAVFVDDDMLVSTTSLVKFLKTESIPRTFYGGHIVKHHAVRKKTSKWYVSPQNYPYELYPPLPSGGFIIMTMNFVIDLHFASQFTKKFILDDCYLGILAYKLHVKPVIVPFVYIVRIDNTNRLFNTDLIAAHGYDPARLKSAWKALQMQFHP